MFLMQSIGRCASGTVLNFGYVTAPGGSVFGHGYMLGEAYGDEMRGDI